MKDLKEALGNARKPDITHARTPIKVYIARNCEYGNDKYERANYIRPTGGEAHRVPTRADFERFRAYLRAADSHLSQTLDAMERHQAMDPNLEDVQGMRTACYAIDMDATPGAAVGASGLPHIGGTCASINMALVQAVDCGLLPSDPGRPWERAAESPSPDTATVVDTVIVADTAHVGTNARIYGEFGDARGYE